MTAPKWKRGDLADRIGNHLFAEAIYQRQLGDLEQVIERVKIRDQATADTRPTYRLVETIWGRPPRVVLLDDTLKDVRRRADLRIA